MKGIYSRQNDGPERLLGLSDQILSDGRKQQLQQQQQQQQELVVAHQRELSSHSRVKCHNHASAQTCVKDERVNNLRGALIDRTIHEQERHPVLMRRLISSLEMQGRQQISAGRRTPLQMPAIWLKLHTICPNVVGRGSEQKKKLTV